MDKLDMQRYATLVVGMFCFLITFNKKAEAEVCRDQGSYCRRATSICHLPFVRKACKSTCQLCATTSPLCKALNCSQRCIITENAASASCACFNGFTLDVDMKTCNDNDECAENPSICSDTPRGGFCANTPGSYTCLTCLERNISTVYTYYESNECCARNLESSCGKSSSNGRIVGGKNAIVRRWPWSVYIRIGSALCGGSLIDRQYVLSAAHCFQPSTSAESISVSIGVVDTEDNTNIHVQSFGVAVVYRHPHYVFPNNDIALLKLDREVLIGDYVRPVCLPNGEEPRVGDKCYATGYGLTLEGGAASATLREVDLPIVDDYVCEVAYSNINSQINSSIHICAGYVEGGKDSCQGDSGGPLVCQRCNNCDWYVAGITSYGKGCARPGFYGVYTRVSFYEPWITGITNQPLRQEVCVKPSWSEWGAWASCSVSCGEGMRTRVRRCVNGQHGVSGCNGNQNDKSTCNLGSCSGWNTWSNWANCSVSCNGGTRTRVRTCSGGSGVCSGDSRESQTCNTHLCGTWMTWGAWNACSLTCGGGQQMRNRICNGGVAGKGGCPGDAKDTKSCFTSPCSVWSNWLNWTTCSVSCNGGTRTRTRTCSGGNDACDGEDSELEPCNTQMCGTWSVWESWKACSLTCGGGQQMRERMCNGGVAGSGGCPGDAEQTRACFTHSCPAWSNWLNWENCTASCNGGTRTRTRRCSGEINACEGENTEIENCNLHLCGSWLLWGPWKTCSLTCGGGQQRRSRKCEGGVAGVDGCPGDAQQTRTCRTNSCPVWNVWSNWATCNASCDGGIRIRTRTCNEGIDACDGESTDIENCNTHLCGTWSSWKPWKTCSLTCGGGQQMRERRCDGGVAGSGGCQGNAEETINCHTSPCSVWRSWSNWTTCSVSCNGGTRTRVRSCSGGNDACDGEYSESEECNSQSCARWSDWAPSGECSTSCGQGELTIVRNCLDGNIGEGECIGLSSRIQPCQVEACPTGWTQWSGYSKCSVTCGSGEQTRRRVCQGDAACAGQPTEVQACDTDILCQIPVFWQEWGSWTTCTRSCSGGTQQRRRGCSGGQIGQTGCTPQIHSVDSRVCNEEPCVPPPCADNPGVACNAFLCSFSGVAIYCRATCNACQNTFTDWTTWSSCSASCNGGAQNRTRTCRYNPVFCQGTYYQLKGCNTQSCDSDANTFSEFTPWTAWSQCSASCGGGTQNRTRLCPPGAVCNPDQYGNNLNQTEACGSENCLGSWSFWGEYSDCSATCGNGERRRLRTCTGGTVANPVCEGSSFEETACNEGPCYASWGPWKVMGSCSVTCGPGKLKENRTCINGVPGDPGCSGNDERVLDCNLGECVGEWGKWTQWSGCSASCEGGRTRTRVCGSSSENCVGRASEREDCNTKPCQVVVDPCQDLSDENSQCGIPGNSYVCTHPTYARFASRNCRLTCCRNRIPGFYGCSDMQMQGYSYCTIFSSENNNCQNSDIADLAWLCKKSCKLCS